MFKCDHRYSPTVWETNRTVFTYLLDRISLTSFAIDKTWPVNIAVAGYDSHVHVYDQRFPSRVCTILKEELTC